MNFKNISFLFRKLIGIGFKILVFIILILCSLLILGVFLDNFIPDSDYCIEDGECEEGREVQTQYGSVLITKENCLKYGWTWFENDVQNYCKIHY